VVNGFAFPITRDHPICLSPRLRASAVNFSFRANGEYRVSWRTSILF